MEEVSAVDNTINNFNDRKITKSSTFIRGMLGYSFSFYGKDFYNCYIHKDILENNIVYIVFKKPFKDINMFLTIVENLKIDDNFVAYKETDNFAVVKMQIPIMYRPDIKHFLNGDYNKMSEEYKDTLLDLVYRYRRNDRLLQAYKEGLYTTKKAIKNLEDKLGASLPKNEIISIPDLEVEAYIDSNFN